VISLAMFGKPERVVPVNVLGQSNAFGNAAFSTVREASYQQTKDNTDHANVSLSTNYKLTKEISLDGTFGIDYVSQRSSNLNPFGYNVDAFVANEINGALHLGKREHTEWTVDMKGNWNRNFTRSISSQFVAGMQGFITSETFSYGSGVTFPGPGIEVLDGGAVQTSQSLFSQIIQAGYFFQEQVGYRDYVYLTGGVRADPGFQFEQHTAQHVSRTRGDWTVRQAAWRFR
jgi:hypothetical protein